MGWRMCQCLSELVLAGKMVWPLLAAEGTFPSPLGTPWTAGQSVVPSDRVTCWPPALTGEIFVND